MAACEFRVRGITAEPNVRGIQMFRIYLSAIASDAFRSDPPADPDGHCSILVSPEFVVDKRLSIGDDAYLVFRKGDDA